MLRLPQGKESAAIVFHQRKDYNASPCEVLRVSYSPWANIDPAPGRSFFGGCEDMLSDP
jgi:hypothetical protein